MTTRRIPRKRTVTETAELIGNVVGWGLVIAVLAYLAWHVYLYVTGQTPPVWLP